jgi:hypothetical protein
MRYAPENSYRTCRLGAFLCRVRWGVWLKWFTTTDWVPKKTAHRDVGSIPTATIIFQRYALPKRKSVTAIQLWRCMTFRANSATQIAVRWGTHLRALIERVGLEHFFAGYAGESGWSGLLVPTGFPRKLRTEMWVRFPPPQSFLSVMHYPNEKV